MKVIGLMSGTSVDGVDAALCEHDPNGRFEIASTHYSAYPADLQAAIHALCEQEPLSDDDIAEVDQRLVKIFANTVDDLLKASKTGADEISVIGSHGQTIRHCPDCAQPYSLQIGSAQQLATITGISTVGDFRTADIQAGGQGAPLAPAFHNAVFRSADTNRAILNIGGIANVTFLPASPSEHVIGFDTGPGNTLMDYWIRKTLGKAYDEHGSWAELGAPNEGLLNDLLGEPYFSMSPPKSTGRELFSPIWLESRIALKYSTLSAQDIAATLLSLTARSIARAVVDFLPDISEVYVCGGGSHNRALLRELRTELEDCRIETTQALGIDPDWVEAAAFAWLAAQTLEGKPGNLPSVTGARSEVILGRLFKP